MDNIFLSNIVFYLLPIVIIGHFIITKLKCKEPKRCRVHHAFSFVFSLALIAGIILIKATGFDTFSGKVQSYDIAEGMFTGTLEKSLPTGEGRLVLNNKTTIKAIFSNGKATGVGVMDFPDGSTYEGEISDNKMNGSGTLSTTKSDGIHTYTGTFVDSIFTGMGTISYPDGKLYRGHCINFLPSTKTMILPPAKSNQKMQLNAINVKALSEEERIAQGTFGSMKFPDGSTYVGEFKNGTFYGEGTFVCATCGHIYTGNFENNFMQGIGKLIKPKGLTMQGKWVNDTFNKKLFSCDNPFYAKNKTLNGGVNDEGITFKDKNSAKK